MESTLWIHTKESNGIHTKESHSRRAAESEQKPPVSNRGSDELVRLFLELSCPHD